MKDWRELVKLKYEVLFLLLSACLVFFALGILWMFSIVQQAKGEPVTMFWLPVLPGGLVYLWWAGGVVQRLMQSDIGDLAAYSTQSAQKNSSSSNRIAVR